MLHIFIPEKFLIINPLNLIIMKKLFFTIVSIIGLVSFAYADNDRPITPDQLPDISTQIIKKHFPSSAIERAYIDDDVMDKDYTVYLAGGVKIEFNSKGEWKEIETRTSVPAALVPTAITQYVKKNYPSCKIEKISRDRRGMDIELSNGLDIEFDKSYRVVEIDD